MFHSKACSTISRSLSQSLGLLPQPLRWQGMRQSPVQHTGWSILWFGILVCFRSSSRYSDFVFNPNKETTRTSISNFASVMHYNSWWNVANAFQNLMGYLIVMICIDFRKRLLVFLWYCFQTYNISFEPLSWVLLYICHIFITWHFDDNGVNCFRCNSISLWTATLRRLWTERYLHGCFDIICVFIKLLWTGYFLWVASL